MAIALTIILAMTIPAVAGTGNNLPSGAHYNLNIIGVPKGKTADMTGDNGHRIFVSLTGKTNILLKEGPDYQVLDANGTDNGASFQLPNPDPDGDGITVYSVFARALGKPGGQATMTTCAYDEYATLWCEGGKLFIRHKGNEKFENVSKELLYVYANLGSGYKYYPLFSDQLSGYFWEYDNAGLKLAQLRFYEVSTNINQ